MRYRALIAAVAAATLVGFMVGRSTADTPTVAAPLPGDAFRSLSAPKGGTVPGMQYGAGSTGQLPRTTAEFPSFPPAPIQSPEPSAVAVSSPTRSADSRVDTQRQVSSGASGRLTGLASWYDGPAGQAAAGPALRSALGAHWRYTVVRVCAGSRCTTARLSDWCACGPRHGKPTLLDLDDALFARLAPLSRGIVSVTVAW